VFEFMLDIGNYEERKVGRFEAPWGFVSTVRVSDGAKPYETAVAHKDYMSSGMVIVEAYDTKEEAALGHAKWVTTMTSSPLPSSLKDCANAGIAALGEALFDDWEDEYPLKP
jgi:hypothetical protein